MSPAIQSSSAVDEQVDATPDLDVLLTVQDVARLLNVPASWVYEHTRSRGDNSPHRYQALAVLSRHSVSRTREGRTARVVWRQVGRLVHQAVGLVKINLNAADPEALTFTHSAVDFSELKQHSGERIQRSFQLLLTLPDSYCLLLFSPVVGMSLAADGDTAELPFRRTHDILRLRRRRFAPLLHIPLWLFPALLTALTYWREGPRPWEFWVAFALTAVMFFGGVRWAPGGVSNLFLIRRHERRSRWAKDNRDLWYRVLGALIAAALVALQARACQNLSQIPSAQAPPQAPLGLLRKP